MPIDLRKRELLPLRSAILISLFAATTVMLGWRRAKRLRNGQYPMKFGASQAGLPLPFIGWAGIAAATLVLSWRQSRDLRETQAALQEVRETERRYRLLAGRLEQIREDESGQLARRMHDDLGQAMTAIRFDLASLLRRLDGQPDLQDRVRGAIAIADEAVKVVRGIALELRPGVLDQLGLVAALEWLGAAFQKQHGIKVAFHSDVETLAVPQERQLILFRIAQEALTNVARHAQASAVDIRVQSAPGCVLMEIADNGRGIPREQIEKPGSFGLISMQGRSRQAGAECRILSSLGGGTMVRIVLPVEAPAVADRAPQGEST